MWGPWIRGPLYFQVKKALAAIAARKAKRAARKARLEDRRLRDRQFTLEHKTGGTR